MKEQINKSKELLDRIKYDVEYSKSLKQYSDKVIKETKQAIKQSRRQLSGEERD